MDKPDPTTPKLPSLSVLRAETIQVIRQGGGSRPDVLRVRCGGEDAILKDQNGCDTGFARVIGPLLAHREGRALSELRTLAGVPNLLGRPDRRSVLMQYLPAMPITRASHTDWRAFFDDLDRLLDEMHELGIAHGDLRSPDNTLVNESGNPVLVDFVASVRRGSWWNLPALWIFTLFCQVDKKAVIKLKSIVAPELVHEDQHHLLEHRSVVHRALRRFGMAIRDVTRRLFTRSV